jgi:TPR repeat protein
VRTDNVLEAALQALDRGETDRAIKWLEQLAASGHARASLELAILYRRGFGARKDEKKAIVWISALIQLAQDGNAEAQRIVSDQYRWGDQLPLDVEKANYWLLQAANNGDADAQYHLSLYFEEGSYGIEKDLQKAKYWFSKTLAQEFPEALYVQGLRAFSGNHPTTEAISWLSRAAQKGFGPAIELLNKLKH